MAASIDVSVSCLRGRRRALSTQEIAPKTSSPPGPCRVSKTGKVPGIVNGVRKKQRQKSGERIRSLASKTRLATQQRKQSQADASPKAVSVRRHDA